jgi:hypothetical protein
MAYLRASITLRAYMADAQWRLKQETKRSFYIRRMKQRAHTAPFFHFAVPLSTPPARMLFVGTLNSLHSEGEGQHADT